MSRQPRNESPDIRIDQDGTWYFRGIEMTRKDIIQYFYQHLQRTDRGCFQILVGGEVCAVEVDDVPYVVRSLSLGAAGKDGLARMAISLSDGTHEELAPETIRFGKNNIPYCRIKEGGYEARFSRQAYYQLAEHIEHDPYQDRYFIIIGDRSYPLVVDQETEDGGFAC